jgi:uncharacterized protein (DUF952 family)
MRDDLIFHITTNEEFNTFKKNGNYEPESLDEKGFIHCSSGHQVEDIANEKFSGHEKILLLVIDVTALNSKIKYEKDSESGKKYPHIYGPLDTNAIIDKIEVLPEDDGQFKIGFTSKT